MADVKSATDGPSPYSADGWDYTKLPDWDNDFIEEDDITEFAKALAAPENSPSNDDLTAPQKSPRNLFITALNDWRPIHQRVRKRKKQEPRRGKDETREGFVYTLLKWPLLFTVFGWLTFLGISYMFTRIYIAAYEQFVTWRGKRESLRKALTNAKTYEEWVEAAKEMDTYLGNDKWKKTDQYAYYDSKTIRRVRDQMVKIREQAEIEEMGLDLMEVSSKNSRPVDELRGLIEACVKNNFVGFENPRLYSESYYGTKDLVQGFVDEATRSLEFLQNTKQLDQESKRTTFKHIQANFGRTALCLSGGATFAYYHFGVAKALLDADLLPNVITGTSGGALVAALLGTRTDEELKLLLVPALANRITACHDSVFVWAKRWWRTGARFDSIDWAARCGWFCRGSMTFREAYERTGRILNVSCVPSDPHSPTILANYITSPDCVIWSAVLASAAVPGILNPVVLMKKQRDGTLAPYSFGHKWKDGSLRTDIPLKALNLHFNARFTIVSQVNPHINLFFFSSRGSVGGPVTHRRGRGWRGGFLGSATEQYLKLDLTKWLKVLRHLELLPRPLGQDWSEIWLQRFSGTITIWPKSIPSDFVYILSDPTPSRLARMIHVGQQSAFPKLKFIANRMKLERVIRAGRRATRPPRSGMQPVLSEDDLQELLIEARKNNGVVTSPWPLSAAESSSGGESSPTIAKRPTIPVSNDKKKLTKPRKGKEDSYFTAKPKASKSKSKLIEKPLPQVPRDGSKSPSDQIPPSPKLSARFSNWFSRVNPSNSSQPRHGGSQKRSSPYLLSPSTERPLSMFELRASERDEAIQRLYDRAAEVQGSRRGSWVTEMERQTRVFVDDSDTAEDAGNTPEKKQKGRKGEAKGTEKRNIREMDMEYYDEDETGTDGDADAYGDDGAGAWVGDDEERAREERAVRKYLGDGDDESSEEEEGVGRKNMKGRAVG